MAKYELPIYGENDVIVKEYTSNICPWAVYIEAAEMQETLKDKTFNSFRMVMCYF